VDNPRQRGSFWLRIGASWARPVVAHSGTVEGATRHKLRAKPGRARANPNWGASKVSADFTFSVFFGYLFT
jgi:hypothetical protein